MTIRQEDSYFGGLRETSTVLAQGTRIPLSEDFSHGAFIVDAVAKRSLLVVSPEEVQVVSAAQMEILGAVIPSKDIVNTFRLHEINEQNLRAQPSCMDSLLGHERTFVYTEK